MNKSTKISWMGFVFGTAILVLINLLTTRQNFWSLIPVALLAWWPIGVSFATIKKPLALACVGASWVIAFTIGLNAAYSPGFPWSLFFVVPILWWPLGVYAKKHWKPLSFAILSFVILTGYFVLLNLWLSPHQPFAVFVTYALLWWPMSLTFMHYRHNFKVSILATILNIVMLYLINTVLKPEYLWSVYLMAAFTYWPVAELLWRKLAPLKFAWISFTYLIFVYGALNLVFETRHPFLIYVAFVLCWWPIGVAFTEHRKMLRLSIEATLLMVLFLGTLNVVLTPHVLWAIYPISVLLIWPIIQLTLHLRERRNPST